MDLTPFIRRWLPKQVAAITSSPQRFRSKLLPDDDAAELELGALQHCSSDYELRQLARDGSADSTASSGHDAAITPAPQADSSSRAAASSQAHQVDDPLADASNVQRHPTSPNDAADSLQQWQESAADVRLVVGVLLESSGSCSSCRQFVEQLLACSSWSEACQRCKDTLLLW